MKKLTIKEAAQKTGAGETTIRRLCRNGVFPNAKQVNTPRGSIWYIPEKDLQDFVTRERGRPKLLTEEENKS